MTTSPQVDILKQNADVHKIIDELFSKYANNTFMLSKIHTYICEQLPNQLEIVLKTQEQRITRIEELNSEQKIFIEDFITKNQYFYVPATELFFHYDGKHYRIYREDDILHHILTQITKDKQLMVWKQRTKVNIMKRIKENNLLKTVPESYTIQNVISTLYPTVFATKTEAKYFLTILGDNILKKNTHLNHFINNNAKPFIRELNNMCQGFLGTNLYQTFKHKYRDHNYQHSRILTINNIIHNEAIWSPMVNTWALDILCVACHYSMRFNCSDSFLLNTNDESICNSVFYLNKREPLDIVNIFISDYLHKIQSPGNDNAVSARTPELETMRGTSIATNTSQYNSVGVRGLSGDDISSQDKVAIPISGSSPGERTYEFCMETNNDISSNDDSTYQITWKNIQYLWKHFLESKNLPSIIIQQTLKTMFIQRFNEQYKTETDSFIGVFSKHMPAIQRFVSFWEETITIQDDDIENDFEIDELSALFKIWCETHNEPALSFNNETLLNLITHFYPHVEIEHDKYIYKIQSSLWDKQSDIQMIMDSLHENEDKISIYDAYRFYCANCAGAKKSLIVSKSYFEKYVYARCPDYIA